MECFEGIRALLLHTHYRVFREESVGEPDLRDVGTISVVGIGQLSAAD